MTRGDTLNGTRIVVSQQATYNRYLNVAPKFIASSLLSHHSVYFSRVSSFGVYVTVQPKIYEMSFQQPHLPGHVNADLYVTGA